MTILDLHSAPHRSSDRAARPALMPWLAALVLLVLIGVPALMAPPAELTPDGWHGNAATHRAQP
ncbi:hypothetical protein [Salipiger abyssi]|uniref:hypothetical protein n=1 Tax=Salipiger abyssi TaxID=1250539 RepID=UPI001A8C5C14|nr:hypothetical protein [Salipiger abyssi]MBN9888980.1 hypothetical protein [Salipiger abyssi]